MSTVEFESVATVYKNCHIVYVGSDPDAVSLFRERLPEELGTSEVVSTPDAALELVYTDWDRAVVVDLDSVGKDGIQLVREIKDFNGGVFSVLLAGEETLGRLAPGDLKDADELVIKPLEEAPLLKMLAAVTRRFSIND